MPKGPKSPKRSGDVIGAAIMVAKIATGERVWIRRLWINVASGCRVLTQALQPDRSPDRQFHAAAHVDNRRNRTARESVRIIAAEWITLSDPSALGCQKRRMHSRRQSSECRFPGLIEPGVLATKFGFKAGCNVRGDLRVILALRELRRVALLYQWIERPLLGSHFQFGFERMDRPSMRLNSR